MLFTNCSVFNGKTFEKREFSVENGLFTQARSGSGTTDLGGAYVIPGLIDIHTHGNSGSDFYDADISGLKKMAEYYAGNGVTSFCGTSMTLPYEMLEEAYRCADMFMSSENPGCARMAGINMEGPFFSEKKKGAQNCKYLKLPDFEAFMKLYECSGRNIRLVDIAAELDGAAEFTKKAKELCAVSVGHTDADYEEAKAVFDCGASHITHMFNGMPGIHHRKPGVIGAAAENSNVYAELICDGLHVHESAVRMAFKLFPGRICLISDSLRCTGMPEGEYEFGGQRIWLRGSIASLSDGTIAGSASNLYMCMLNAVRFGISKAEAINAVTANPAKSIGIYDRLGSIDSGKLADFVVCDRDLNRLKVYIGGAAV